MNGPSGAKRPVDATLVKVLTHARDDRGMRLDEFASRCVRVGELHELVATDHAETTAGSRIDRVWFLGFAEISRAGVVERGDEVRIGSHRIGTVLGFDSCHFPNHYNILIHSLVPATGAALALAPELPVRFASGEAAGQQTGAVPGPPARIDAPAAAPDAYRAMAAFDAAAATDLDPRLAELVRVRAAQLNGCSFCLRLHTRAAVAAGESPERLARPAARPGTAGPAVQGMSVSADAPAADADFTDRERAALALAEAVTLLPAGVSDPVYADAARQFDDKELAQLIWTVAAVNAWNRVAVATGLRAPARAEPPAPRAGNRSR